MTSQNQAVDKLVARHLTDLIATDREKERAANVRWLRARSAAIKKEWLNAPSDYERAALGGEWRALKDAAEALARLNPRKDHP